MLLRAMICAVNDNPGKVDLAEALLDENRPRLTYVSEMNGCGCCVGTWDIEGAAEVVETIPPHLVVSGDWAGSVAKPKR